MELHQTRCPAAPFDPHAIAVGVTDESDFYQSVVLTVPALHVSDAFGDDVALDWAGAIRSHEKTIANRIAQTAITQQASRWMS